jgi:hypothetical protein
MTIAAAFFMPEQAMPAQGLEVSMRPYPQGDTMPCVIEWDAPSEENWQLGGGRIFDVMFREVAGGGAGTAMMVIVNKRVKGEVRRVWKPARGGGCLFFLRLGPRLLFFSMHLGMVGRGREGGRRGKKASTVKVDRVRLRG